MGLGKGYITGSLSAMAQAKASAADKSRINPYDEFAQGIGAFTQSLRNYYSENAYAGQVQQGMNVQSQYQQYQMQQPQQPIIPPVMTITPPVTNTVPKSLIMGRNYNDYNDNGIG